MNHHRSLILFLVVLGFAVPVKAFINIESLRQNLKSGFYGSSGAALAGSSGNVDVFNVGTNTRNIYKKGDHETIFIAKYEYGEAKGSKNTNTGNVHLRYAQHFSPYLQWELFGQLEFNEFQSLELRTLSGGGLRWRLFDDKRTSFFFGTGAFYEDETIDGDIDQANGRGNVYLSLRKIVKQSLEAVASVYYQPSFLRVDDYRIQASLGFEFQFTKSLKWVNLVGYAMDTAPPSGIKKEDINFKVGFNYEY